MITYVLFFFVLAILTGVFALIVTGPFGPIMFFVALALFAWSGAMYLRERRRGARR
jgi:uncharacterized membrane protein YqgA involved in biofilm formation